MLTHYFFLVHCGAANPQFFLAEEFLRMNWSGSARLEFLTQQLLDAGEPANKSGSGLNIPGIILLVKAAQVKINVFGIKSSGTNYN